MIISFPTTSILDAVTPAELVKDRWKFPWQSEDITPRSVQFPGRATYFASRFLRPSHSLIAFVGALAAKRRPT